MKLGFLTAFFVVGILEATASANNNLFLPGDAFFPVALTADSLTELKSKRPEDRLFEHSSFGEYSGAFCGYAGYDRAAIPAVNDAFMANLEKAYAEIRKYNPRILVERIENGKAVLEETNGVRVLFYPEAFEFPRFKLGLQYNENWVAETIKFGHRPEDIRLCCLVDTTEAVMESWRDSHRVATFSVALPNVPLRSTPATDAPITIKDKVKAIVLAPRPLKEYFSPVEYSALEVRIVDSAGIERFDFMDGKWTKASN